MIRVNVDKSVTIFYSRLSLLFHLFPHSSLFYTNRSSHFFTLKLAQQLWLLCHPSKSSQDSERRYRLDDNGLTGNSTTWQA